MRELTNSEKALIKHWFDSPYQKGLRDCFVIASNNYNLPLVRKCCETLSPLVSVSSDVLLYNINAVVKL